MEGREEKERSQNGFLKDMLALPDPALIIHDLPLDGGNGSGCTQNGDLPWTC